MVSDTSLHVVAQSVLLSFGWHHTHTPRTRVSSSGVRGRSRSRCVFAAVGSVPVFTCDSWSHNYLLRTRSPHNPKLCVLHVSQRFTEGSLEPVIVLARNTCDDEIVN